jgi:hypothetical protein
MHPHMLSLSTYSRGHPLNYLEQCAQSQYPEVAHAAKVLMLDCQGIRTNNSAYHLLEAAQKRARSYRNVVLELIGALDAHEALESCRPANQSYDEHLEDIHKSSKVIKDLKDKIKLFLNTENTTLQTSMLAL